MRTRHEAATSCAPHCGYRDAQAPEFATERGRPRRWRNRDCHRLAICCRRMIRTVVAGRRETDMAICLVAPRRVTLRACAAGAFGDRQAPAPRMRRSRSRPPAATPSGQKAGRDAARARRAASAGRRAAPAAAGFDHQTHARASRADARLHRHRRLDPSVRRQGRAAGRYRLHRLSARWRRRAHPAGDLPVQRRAGRGLGLAAIRRRRSVAARHQRRRGDVLRVA